jgi:hypothetical protein
MRRFALATLVIGALQLAPGAWAAPAPESHGSTALPATVALRQTMRKLWSDHAFWTREYIVAAVAGDPDQAAAAGRLMKNQEDIGAAVAGFYGDAAGVKLTSLLKEHISIAVDLIKAAKAGDAAAQRRADTAWHQNGEDIAAFLSQANPHWPRPVLVEMMNMHLSTTTDEVVARLTKDWDKDVKAFDTVYQHLLDMSDALSDGIIAQFPARFGRDQ